MKGYFRDSTTSMEPVESGFCEIENITKQDSGDLVGILRSKVDSRVQYI